MALTDVFLKNALPKAKPYKVFDGEGLYIEIRPNGGKWWRLKYRYGGKEKRISLGTYPAVSLKQARTERSKARLLLDQGIDPSEDRKLSEKVETGENSFERVALEWFSKNRPTWSDSYAKKLLTRLEKDLFPWLGARDIDEITPPELLKVLRRMEARGALEKAHRARNDCSRIFRYAIATGRAERDTAADLKGAIAPRVTRHHPSITDPVEIGKLLRAIDAFEGSFTVRCALQLLPLVFVRTGELRHAEWSEFDIEGAVWRIPAEKMKMRAPHIVPLSRQAIAILTDLYALTGGGKLVFPGARSPARPMSENTINAALRRLGYEKGEMCGHGFRSMASTRLNESQQWAPDVIERQLAHGERNSVRASYNYAQHLEERTRMMQWWADYLDSLKRGAEVLSFTTRAS